MSAPALEKWEMGACPPPPKQWYYSPMRCAVVVCVIAFLSTPALSREQKSAEPMPDHFEIGRETHFDFGPPFNYYEVFVVRSRANGASVERVILTPAADKCFAPAKFETASGSINEPVSALLGSKNPCTIPERRLRHELTRGRHHLVFSFADVVMQVQCGAETRLLRSYIMDRDMFDPAANTPEHTSWTMRLMERLDAAVGPGVMDKPSFPTLTQEDNAPRISDSETLRNLGAAKYDGLFQDTNFRLSALYSEAVDSHPAQSSVRLVRSVPTQPEVYVQPEYPPLAKMAKVEGEVSFVMKIDANGGTKILTFGSAHPLLRASVEKAVAGWKFPADMITYEVQATVEFAIVCAGTQEH